MLDLETLGNSHNAVIISIGDVKFNDLGILSEFYERITAQSCVELGLTLDVATILWWMSQSDEAREEICKPAKPLQQVLTEFSEWVNDDQATIWGNGAAFDNVILSSAYHAAKLPKPWNFRNDRCYRTVKSLNPFIPMPAASGIKHHALDDARCQAFHLLQILSSKTHIYQN